MLGTKKVPGFIRCSRNMVSMSHDVGTIVPSVELTCPQGAIIRIAPNVVLTNERTAIRSIYGTTKVIKSTFYDQFGIINGEQTCLTLRDPVEATHRRRCYLPIFSRRNLLEFSPKIYGHMQEFIAKLREIEAMGEPVDALRWWRYLTFDIISKA